MPGHRPNRPRHVGYFAASVPLRIGSAHVATRQCSGEPTPSRGQRAVNWELRLARPAGQIPSSRKRRDRPEGHGRGLAWRCMRAACEWIEPASRGRVRAGVRLMSSAHTRRLVPPGFRGRCSYVPARVEALIRRRRSVLRPRSTCPPGPKLACLADSRARDTDSSWPTQLPGAGPLAASMPRVRPRRAVSAGSARRSLTVMLARPLFISFICPGQRLAN
jgi:hypothetical protein